MNKHKIAPSVILLIKLFFCLSIMTPQCCFYFFAVYNSLILSIIEDSGTLLHLLLFVILFILHIAFILLYIICKKNACKIFGSIVILLLAGDIFGFASMFPYIPAIIGMVTDAICIALIIISLFKIKSNNKKTWDGSLS